MNPEDALRLIRMAATVSESVLPIIRQAMVTLPSGDQAQVEQEAKRLAEANDALHRAVTARLRG